MRLPPLLLVSLLGLAIPRTSARPQQPATGSVLQVRVEVPGAPGTKVNIRYVEAPDSLRGRVQEVTAPAEFTLRASAITLIAERADRQGQVRVRVERRAKRLTGEGTAELVRIEVTSDEVHVRAFPRSAPI